MVFCSIESSQLIDMWPSKHTHYFMFSTLKTPSCPLALVQLLLRSLEWLEEYECNLNIWYHKNHKTNQPLSIHNYPTTYDQTNCSEPKIHL